MKYSGWLLSVIGGGFLAVLPARSPDAHPVMDSEYRVNTGAFFSRRNIAASAGLSLAVDALDTDIERTPGMKDHEQLGMFELGWQFGEKRACRLNISGHSDRLAPRCGPKSNGKTL